MNNSVEDTPTVQASYFRKQRKALYFNIFVRQRHVQQLYICFHGLLFWVILCFDCFSQLKLCNGLANLVQFLRMYCALSLVVFFSCQKIFIQHLYFPLCCFLCVVVLQTFDVLFYRRTVGFSLTLFFLSNSEKVSSR